MCSAFNNILDKFKLPYLALPFNIIATASFMALHAFYEDAEDNGKFFYEKQLRFSYVLSYMFISHKYSYIVSFIFRQR